MSAARKAELQLWELEIAQHEAAHVVVGCALGLRLERAAIVPLPPDTGWIGWTGYAWFPRAQSVAYHLMVAAGCAWDAAAHGKKSVGDETILREAGYTAADIKTLSFSAGLILTDRGVIHAEVTRLLLTRRRITQRDLDRFIARQP